MEGNFLANIYLQSLRGSKYLFSFVCLPPLYPLSSGLYLNYHLFCNHIHNIAIDILIIIAMITVFILVRTVKTMMVMMMMIAMKMITVMITMERIMIMLAIMI